MKEKRLGWEHGMEKSLLAVSRRYRGSRTFMRGTLSEADLLGRKVDLCSWSWGLSEVSELTDE